MHSAPLCYLLSWHTALYYCQGWLPIGVASVSASVMTVVVDVVQCKKEGSTTMCRPLDLSEACAKWVVVWVCALVYSYTMYVYEWRSKVALNHFKQQQEVRSLSNGRRTPRAGWVWSDVFLWGSHSRIRDSTSFFPTPS